MGRRILLSTALVGAVTLAPVGPVPAADVQVQFGHRIMFVNSDDVDIRPVAVSAPS